MSFEMTLEILAPDIFTLDDFTGSIFNLANGE